MLRLGLRVIGCLIGFGGLNGEDNHQISNTVPNINQVCLSCKLRGNYVIFVRSIQTLQLILLERELIALFNGILIVKKY